MSHALLLSLMFVIPLTTTTPADAPPTWPSPVLLRPDGGVAGSHGGSGGCHVEPRPVITLTSLLPDRIGVGSPDFTLTVNGTGFVSGVVVEFAGNAMVTTYVSSTQVTAIVPASELLQSGNRSVRVSGSGPLSNPLTFSVESPVLSSLDPAVVLAGTPGVTVNLTGEYFVPGSQAMFGNQSRPTTYVDAQHLSMSLSAADLQNATTRTVRVDSLPSAAGGTSNGLQFAVVNPLLQSLSPTAAVVGSATLPLTVTGLGFGATSRIRFDGHLLTTTTWTATSVTADVPAPYLTQPGIVGVEVNGSASGPGTSNSLSFTVGWAVPTLTAIDPVAVTVGANINYIMLTGSGFVQQSDALWNGSPRSTQYIDPTTLRMTVGNHDLETAGVFPITVVNPAPGGGASSAQLFTVNNPLPAVTGTSPATLPAGSGSTNIVILGSGFNSQTTVEFDSVPLVIGGLLPSNLSVLVPAALIANAQIAVLRIANPAPGGGVAWVTMPITNPQPAVTAVQPSSVPIGSGAQTISVFGTFNSQSEVRWNGSPLPTTFVSNSQLTAIAGASLLTTAAEVSITVVNPPPGGGSSNAVSFTVANPTPTLASISPFLATAGSAGFTLTIAGNQFISGCVATWDGATLSSSLAGGIVTASVPASLLVLGGVKTIRVVNPGPGGGPSNALSFVVLNPAPTLNSIAPDTMLAGSGTSVLMLSGANFAAQSVAQLDGNPLPTTFHDASTLSALISAATLATAGNHQVRVVTPAPGGGATQTRNLSVLNPVPSLDGLSNMIAPAGSSPQVTAFGGGFTSQSWVTMTQANGSYITSFTPNVVSGWMMILNVPGSYLGGPGEVRLAITNPGPGGGTSQAIPFTFAAPPTPVVDDHPVTFSVSGPVHRQPEGLTWARGVGPSTGFGLRAPDVAPALGLPTAMPGDVQDYAMAAMPAEAELFQAEPMVGSGRPTTNQNQILVADDLGLVAGTPFADARDNIDGFSFGEDWFGVTAVALGSQPNGWIGQPIEWSQRNSQFLPNVVTDDVGTSFRFSVDTHARGQRRTAVAIESLRFDLGSGLGPWTSLGEAGAEVFGSPLLTLPGVPAIGTNMLVHARPSLALGNATSGVFFGVPAEDDLDALECIGDNNPASWFGVLPPMLGDGDLHARVADKPAHAAFPDGLAPPGVSIHGIGIPGPFGVTSAPVFFTVDQNATGRALSAVRTQSRDGEAAGDVFMTWNDDNLLLIDEQEAGLYQGQLGVHASDDMDALLLLVHPDDRYYLVELAQFHVPNSGLVVVHDPNPFVVGDEYRTGPGYSYSLLRFAWDRDQRVLRIRLGFSVTSASIGLDGTPVDYETGLDPSGTMQQAGDVYFTQFGVFDPALGLINPVPMFSDHGTHYRWYEEVELGLDPGAWVLGATQDFAFLPDNLDGLDSTPMPPGGPMLIAAYGAGCAGTSGVVPVLDAIGRETESRVVAFGLGSGLAGAPCLLAQSVQAADLPFVPGCNLLVPPTNMVLNFVGLLQGPGAGDGAQLWSMRIPPGLSGIEFATQGAVLDPGSGNGFVATSNGVMVRVQ